MGKLGLRNRGDDKDCTFKRSTDSIGQAMRVGFGFDGLANGPGDRKHVGRLGTTSGRQSGRDREAPSSENFVVDASLTEPFFARKVKVIVYIVSLQGPMFSLWWLLNNGLFHFGAQMGSGRRELKALGGGEADVSLGRASRSRAAQADLMNGAGRCKGTRASEPPAPKNITPEALSTASVRAPRIYILEHLLAFEWEHVASVKGLFGTSGVNAL
jgi:hypothetical protein